MSKSVLLVDIPANQTVGHLREAIWEKKRAALANIVDADDLTLWKVGSFSPLSLIYADEILSGTCI